MPISRYQIFIASRFEEFSELRSALRDRINSFPAVPFEAIDFNDGRVSNRPPLVNCLEAVNRAEAMILLVGETYGSIPSGESLGYTHLEYRAAAASDSQTLVIPYFIGPSYRDGKVKEWSKDPLLAKWQKEIFDNHIAGFCSGDYTPRELAQTIFDWAFKDFYETRLDLQEQKDIDQALSSYTADLENNSSLANDTSLSIEELQWLENRIDEKEKGDILFSDTGEEIHDLTEILKRPAEMAALEQRREAFKAIRLNDRITAIQHLRRAIDLRPLDWDSNFWLARLLFSTGRAPECREAIRFATRAARMAEFDTRPIRTSAAYLLAARTASRIQEFDQGLYYAKLAKSASPWLAAANIEMACQFAYRNQLEDAYSEVRQAFLNHPPSILKINHEPVFLSGMILPEIKKRLLKEFRETLRSLLKQENILRREFGEGNESEVDLEKLLGQLDKFSLLTLLPETKNSLHRCLHLLQYGGEQEFQQRGYGTDDASISRDVRVFVFPRDLGNGANMDYQVTETHKFTSNIVLKNEPIFTYTVVIDGETKTYSFCSPFHGKLMKIVRFKDAIREIEIRPDLSREEVATIDGRGEKSKLSELCRQIVEYEQVIAKSRLFDIGVPLRTATPGSIVRIDPERTYTEFHMEVDSSIVPPYLIHKIDPAVFQIKTRHQFYKFIEAKDEKIVLKRWPVYFPLGN